MALEKVLHKIQSQIKDLAPTLELFVEETVQPSVKECENLQQQLTLLQENLAVYKYNKLNKEISPSFNIHAKVSEIEKVETKTVETKIEIREEVTEIKTVTPEVIKTNTVTAPAKANLAIGINDKFRFINELFSQNISEYNIALEQLNNLQTLSDTETYLASLKSLYNWDEKNEAVRYFYSLVKNSF